MALITLRRLIFNDSMAFVVGTGLDRLPKNGNYTSKGELKWFGQSMLRARRKSSLRASPKLYWRTLFALMLDIELGGPVRGDWPNYGKLDAITHHCHLKKGHPTYVAVWEESADSMKLIEVTYVGTHERAPY